MSAAGPRGARALVLLLTGSLATFACHPHEKVIVVHPDGSSAARGLFDVTLVQRITVQETLPITPILRPDEFAGVSVDHERDLIYVGSRDGTLLGLDREVGEVRWERELDGPISGRPILTGTESDAKRALLLVGTDNGTLFALDPDSHEEVWRYETEGRLRTTPAVVDNVVYIVNSRDQVLALDLGSGAWRWQYEQEMPTTGFTIYGQAGVSIVERAGGVEESATLYTCFGNGKVVALSATSGEALWLASVAPDTGGEFIDCDTTPVLDPDRNTLYVAGHETGLFALAMDDGSQRWRYAARGVGALGRGRGGDIVATSSLEGLLVVDLQGQLVWRAQVDPGVLSVPILVDGTLYATHSESGLLAFDAASGEYLARIDLGSGMSSIPVYDEPTATFYAISNRGMLLGMKIQRGTPRLGLRGDGASSM